jgi:hypothetical protein
MLALTTLNKIVDETQRYWSDQRKNPDLIGRAQGKEIGHKLADWVDERTCAKLTLELSTKRQHSRAGSGAMSRSMGDIWIEDQRIFHPVNVKTGIVGAEGQPNLVSLKKVLDAFLEFQIDSYYLLFVKFAPEPGEVTAKVYLADMLDIPTYLTFDSGPGQMMLKGANFFREIEPGVFQPQKSLAFAERIDLLLNMLEDGEMRLRKNRERDLASYRNRVSQYRSACVGKVTPETQHGLNLR